jgi:lauroyl/myristoyl acyltransferase
VTRHRHQRKRQNFPVAPENTKGFEQFVVNIDPGTCPVVILPDEDNPKQSPVL